MIIDLESNYKYLRVDFEEVFKSIADLDTTNVITTDIVNSIIVEEMVPNDDVFNILDEWGFEKTNNGLNRFKLDVISLPIKQFRNQLGDLSLLGNLYNTNTIDDLNNLNKAIPSANKNIDIPSNLVGNFKYLRVDYEELFKTVAEYLDCTADDVLKILKNEVSDDLLLKIREKITDADLDKETVVNKIIIQIIQLPIRQLPGYLGDIALLGNLYNSTTQTSEISAFPDIKRSNSFNLLPDAEEGAAIIKQNEPLILTNNGEQEVEVNLSFDEDTKTVVYQLEAKEDDGQYMNYEKYIGKWRQRQWVLYTQLMNAGSPDQSAAKSYQHTKQRIMFEGITDNGEGLSVFKESCLNVDLEQIPNKNTFGGDWTIDDLLDFQTNTHGYGQLDDELYIKSNGVIFKREEKRLFLPPYQTSIWVMLYYKIYNNGDVDDTTPKITVQVDLSYHQHVAYMKYGEGQGFTKNGLYKQNNIWGRQPNFYTENPNDFFQDPPPQAQYNDHGLGIDGINENKGYIETAIKLLISTKEELEEWYKTFNTYHNGYTDVDEWGNNATGASDPKNADDGKQSEENWERRFVRDPMGPGNGNVAKEVRKNISQSITFGPYIKIKENGEKDMRIFGPSGCGISAKGPIAAHGQPGFEGSEFPKMIEFDLDIGKINEKNVSNGGLINIWQDISGSGLGAVQLDGDTEWNGDETSSHRYITGIDYVDARVIAFDVPNKRYVFNKNVIEFIPIDNSDKYRIKYSPQKEYLSDSLEGGTFTVDPSFVKLELFTNVTDEEIEDSTFRTALTTGLQVSVKPLKDDNNTENVGYTTTLIFDPRFNDDGTIMGKLDTSVFSEFSDLMGKTAEMNREKQLLPLETIDKDIFKETEWISTENTTAEQRLNRYAKMEYNDAQAQVYHGTTTTTTNQFQVRVRMI